MQSKSWIVIQINPFLEIQKKKKKDKWLTQGFDYEISSFGFIISVVQSWRSSSALDEPDEPVDLDDRDEPVDLDEPVEPDERVEPAEPAEPTEPDEPDPREFEFEFDFDREPDESEPDSEMAFAPILKTKQTQERPTPK